MSLDRGGEVRDDNGGDRDAGRRPRSEHARHVALTSGVAARAVRPSAMTRRVPLRTGRPARSAARDCRETPRRLHAGAIPMRSTSARAESATSAGEGEGHGVNCMRPSCFLDPVSRYLPLGFAFHIALREPCFASMPRIFASASTAGHTPLTWRLEGWGR